MKSHDRHTKGKSFSVKKRKRARFTSIEKKKSERIKREEGEK